MNDPINDHQEWVEYVRAGAEISLAVSAAVIGVLDALDRRRSLTADRPDEPSRLPVPTTRDEEATP